MKTKINKKYVVVALILSALALGLFFISQSKNLPQNNKKIDIVKWPENQTAAAWETTETFLLFKHNPTYGISTDVKLVYDQNNPKRKVLLVQVPANSFHSDSAIRDWFIKKYLSENVQPVLEFSTVGIEKSIFDAIKNHHPGEIPGYLRIANQGYQLSFSFKYFENNGAPFLEVAAECDFAHLGIPTPSLLWGLIVAADERVKMRLRIDMKDFPKL